MYTRRDFIKLSTLFTATATAALPLLQACGKNAAMRPDAPLTIGYLPIVDAAAGGARQRPVCTARHQGAKARAVPLVGGAGGSVFVGAGEPDSRALVDERVDALRQPYARARAVLQPEPVVWQKYERSGAIRHAEWQQRRRVDFQPFPFQSYSELLVRLLKETHLAGVNTFLHDVQPEKAARELFDTRFVEHALQRNDLMFSFGLQSLKRQETFDL